MAVEFAVYQPIKESSLYESFLQGRELAMKRQQLKLEQDMKMDDYVASIMRDPNFTKDSPYNPYINQKLKETLDEARYKYQTGELNASTFKSYVANNIGKINLWVQSADQLMAMVGEGVDYYKSKGADVTSIKNRAARNIFMDEKGNWRSGDQLNQMMQEGKFTNVVTDVVVSNPELAFKDMKALDDWLNTSKTSKENITLSSSTTVAGQKGKKTSGVGVKGVADYYPMWQEVETNAAGVPIGVKSKNVPLDQLKRNDAVWFSAVAAVKKNKIDAGEDATNITEQEVVDYVTNYANQKRPYNFTKDEEKQSTNITYKVTNTSGGGDGGGNVDYNIFSQTIRGTLPSNRYFDGSGDVVNMLPGFLNKLVVGEMPGAYGGASQKIMPKSLVLNKKDKSITVTLPDNTSQTYIAGSPGYSTFMTQLKMNNPWLEQSGRDQPELNKKAGFRTNF
jgi:hypothetical protein